MAHVNGLVNGFVGRVSEISTASVLSSGRNRAHNIAAQMTRRGAMSASAELCNTAVTTLIGLTYEQDDCGFCNIDEHTGVFERFALPWGRFYQRYGLRATERLVLSVHVKRLMGVDVAPLWTYDATTRRWACNIFDYPTRNDALIYWRNVGELTGNDYKLMLQTMQNR